MKNYSWKIFNALKFYFIVGMFHPEHDALIFLDYINSRHPNIRFTMEKELNRKLPFLDVLIDNSDTNSFLTRVYLRKPLLGY